jgi:3-oxoacyl-[acyl-carrier-protein] synthase III
MTCAVVGIGRTEYSRNSGRTTRGMAVAACRDAIADAGLTPADVDGICTFMANDSEQPIFARHRRISLGQRDVRRRQLGG